MEKHPRHLEPPNYLAWRRQLVHDLCRVSIGDRSPHDQACNLFWVNTEMMLEWTKSPISEQVLLAWDDDEKEGVWILEQPTEEIVQRLVPLLNGFMHWHEALEKCGAVHFDHWSDHPWGKAAAEEDKVHFWYKSRNVEEPTAESEEATKERAQSAIQTHFNVRL